MDEAERRLEPSWVFCGWRVTDVDGGWARKGEMLN